MRRNRQRVLHLFCVICVCIVGPGIWAQDNILVIVLDDAGVDVVDCYEEGVSPALMPNVCDLQAGGVLFRNAWSNPVCTPTRASIQTGKYGFRTGVLAAGHVLPPMEQEEIPAALPRELNGNPVPGKPVVHGSHSTE